MQNHKSIYILKKAHDNSREQAKRFPAAPEETRYYETLTTSKGPSPYATSNFSSRVADHRGELQVELKDIAGPEHSYFFDIPPDTGVRKRIQIQFPMGKSVELPASYLRTDGAYVFPTLTFEQKQARKKDPIKDAPKIGQVRGKVDSGRRDTLTSAMINHFHSTFDVDGEKVSTRCLMANPDFLKMQETSGKVKFGDDCKIVRVEPTVGTVREFVHQNMDPFKRHFFAANLNTVKIPKSCIRVAPSSSPDTDLLDDNQKLDEFSYNITVARKTIDLEDKDLFTLDDLEDCRVYVYSNITNNQDDTQLIYFIIFHQITHFKMDF